MTYSRNQTSPSRPRSTSYHISLWNWVFGQKPLFIIRLSTVCHFSTVRRTQWKFRLMLAALSCCLFDLGMFTLQQPKLALRFSYFHQNKWKRYSLEIWKYWVCEINRQTGLCRNEISGWFNIFLTLLIKLGLLCNATMVLSPSAWCI